MRFLKFFKSRGPVTVFEWKKNLIKDKRPGCLFGTVEYLLFSYYLLCIIRQNSHNTFVHFWKANLSLRCTREFEFDTACSLTLQKFQNFIILLELREITQKTMNSQIYMKRKLSMQNNMYSTPDEVEGCVILNLIFRQKKQ